MISSYPLHVSQYSGIYPVDPFSKHSLNGMKFSTKYSDNDQWSSSYAHNFMAMHDGLTCDNIKSCLSLNQSINQSINRCSYTYMS